MPSQFNKNIIIIDDDKEIWQAYRHILGKKISDSRDEIHSLLKSQTLHIDQNYQIDFASQGQIGFDKIKQSIEDNTPYCLAFIDIRMPPGWNGVKTASSIRDIDKNIEIVIVTAFSDFSRENIVEQIGAADKLLYLRKPFDYEEVSQIALSLSEKWNIIQQEQQQHDKITSLLIEIKHSKDYLTDIINSMPSILIGIDKNQCINLWNTQAEVVTQIKLNQAIGLPLDEAFPELQETMINAKLDAKNSTKKLKKIKLHWQNQWHYINIILYPATDKPDNLIIRIDDITQQILMEEIMIQSDKMLIVGSLAAGLAHEINNPLGSILQNAQLIGQRLSLRLKKNEDIAKNMQIDLETLLRYTKERGIDSLLEQIKKDGKRTSELVKSMLTFSRESSDSKQNTNLNKVLQDALKLASNDYELRKKLRYQETKITTRLQPCLKPIHSDPIKIQQVIFNIIKNACHAMLDTVHPELVFCTTSDAEKVTLTISDNGPGMPEDTRKKIFNPFFTTKPVGEGTGLGLSLAYFIITDSHHGKMFVESEPGCGATFTIQLPLEVNTQ